eukprot:TRINITY_DN115695_c0_g1_i1.p1 TRINITY_DN115695_c0_g1~~TRINITY_DN115695_c0_g1_i1.p1  ORF type:complete len:328 (-),score=71.62 TRINITY_DN115695_c0_g1_i1:39-1022(-)
MTNISVSEIAPAGDMQETSAGAPRRRTSRSPRRSGDSGYKAAGTCEEVKLAAPKNDDFDVNKGEYDAAAAVEEMADAKQTMGQIRLTTAYLMQFLQPDPPPGSRPRTSPKEFAAGIPIEPARALLLSPTPEDMATHTSSGSRAPAPQVPWSRALVRLQAWETCLAASLRLFSILLPKQVPGDACMRFCQSRQAADPSSQASDAGSQRLVEAADAWGLTARAVASAVESLEAMTKNQACACCLFIDDYVAVLEDPETGEETEQEVGAHCVLILGGDLAGGPSYIVLDPLGSGQHPAGDISYWTSHEALKSSPSAWIELAPKASSSGMD